MQSSRPSWGLSVFFWLLKNKSSLSRASNATRAINAIIKSIRQSSSSEVPSVWMKLHLKVAMQCIQLISICGPCFLSLLSYVTRCTITSIDDLNLQTHHHRGLSLSTNSIYDMMRKLLTEKIKSTRWNFASLSSNFTCKQAIANALFRSPTRPSGQFLSYPSLAQLIGLTINRPRRISQLPTKINSICFGRISPFKAKLVACYDSFHLYWVSTQMRLISLITGTRELVVFKYVVDDIPLVHMVYC